MAGLLNRVQTAVSGTPGTGTITLGAATAGFQAPAAAGVADGDWVSYLITEGSPATAWELGVGQYSSTGPTITRGVRESSAGGAAINATSAAVVSIVALAEDYFQAVALPPRSSSEYQVSQSYVGRFNINGTLVANRLYAVPWFNPITQSITRIGCRVGTAVVSQIRLGLYRTANGNQPGRLVVDAGAVDGGTVGEKEATFGAVVLRPGLYWMVLVADAASVLIGASQSNAMFGIDSTTSGTGRWLQRTFTAGALPADESSQTYAISSNAANSAPLIWVRN